MSRRFWFTVLLALGLFSRPACAQELQMKVTVNHKQIQGSDDAVFESLRQKMEQTFNDRQWTSLQFGKKERIPCSLDIRVKEYDPSSGRFTCEATIQANRPVWNSSYMSTLYHDVDGDFDFEFALFDELDFREETVDNQLTALMAYYAYLMIGLDLDSFSPYGGEDVLQRCMNLVNDAQHLDFPGWKAFADGRNRFAIIDDYLDGAMKPFRQLQYDYYRKGLDEMSTNVALGRAAVTKALEEDLKKAHDNRPLSSLPAIWTGYKGDELVGIYQWKATPKEKETAYDILSSINASRNDQWEKIKQ